VWLPLFISLSYLFSATHHLPRSVLNCLGSLPPELAAIPKNHAVWQAMHLYIQPVGCRLAANGASQL
jgi:hypothetical protein